MQEMKEIYVLLRIKKWEINLLLQYTLKKFISDDLQLPENDKRSRVKSDKPIFTG